MVKIIFIIVGAVAAVLLAIVLTIMLTFIIWVKHSDKVSAGQKKIVNTYPSEIEKELEEKYDRKFVVDPKFVLDTSNPIPFAEAYAPYEYVVKEDGEDGYVFKVWVYPKSAKDKQIKEIRDNYYWKTIEKETKKYMEENMKALLPKEYKIIFFASTQKKFDNQKMSMPMEEYCKTLQHQIMMRVWIVAPTENEMESKQMTKENVYPIIKNFYKENHENIWIRFSYYNAASDEDYKRLDISELEASVFQTGDKYDIDSLNLIERLNIDIK